MSEQRGSSYTADVSRRRRVVHGPRCRRSGYASLSAVAAGLVTLTASSLASGMLQAMEPADDIHTGTLDSMKVDMSINFLEAALLQATVSDDGTANTGGCSFPGEAGCSWPTYSMTDVDGVIHTCTVRQESHEKRASPRKRANGRDVAKALDPLEGLCATLHHDYWSYKWCHRRNVIQFHEDAEGGMTTINLGKHMKTEVKRADESTASARHASGSTRAEKRSVGSDLVAAARAERERRMGREAADAEEASYAEGGGLLSRMLRLKGRKPGPYDGVSDISDVSAVLDYYEDGDPCEEAGHRRRTRTSITCCAAQSSEVDGEVYSPMAFLVAIEEVTMCSYHVQICSKLLCPSLAEGDVKDSSRRHTTGAEAVAATSHSGGVLSILEELSACFPPKRESYWSYKLCFSTGISQYHTDTVRLPTGEQVSGVTTAFSLGAFDISSVEDAGQDLIQEGQDGAPGAIVLEFTGGTECDLTGVLRSSTVYLKCAPVQGLVEIVEDRTCHYRIVAVSPLLCSHPVLMPKQASVRTVECVAEGTTMRKAIDEARTLLQGPIV